MTPVLVRKKSLEGLLAYRSVIFDGAMEVISVRADRIQLHRIALKAGEASSKSRVQTSWYATVAVSPINSTLPRGSTQVCPQWPRYSHLPLRRTGDRMCHGCSSGELRCKPRDGPWYPGQRFAQYGGCRITPEGTPS